MSNRRLASYNKLALLVHRMLKKSLATLVLMGSALSSAYAEPCVKVRSGNDRYSCMKFSADERKKASVHGLRLGTPYARVKQHLVENGWSIDRQRMDENLAAEPTKEGLVCGSGWDAVCSTAFRKNHKTISLVLSGTNEGIPLISVEMEPSR
jgi:hypothetical protein